MCVSGSGARQVTFVNAITVSSGTLDAVMCDVQGAVEVVRGLFMGGFEEARFGIRTGSKQSDRFRYVLGVAHTCYVITFERCAWQMVSPLAVVKDMI